MVHQFEITWFLRLCY